MAARFRATGARSVSSGTNAPIALLMSGPRPASAWPNPIVEAATPTRVGRREHRQDLVEVDRGPRLADRHGGAVGESASRVAGRDLEVLESDRSLQPDREPGVDRQRLDALIHAQVQLRDRAPAREPLRGHARDDADQRPADPHVRAVRQLARVGDLDVELVARHERQAVGRVVGERHRDDRHQHGQRADQDRAAGDARGRAAAPHLPAPDQVAEQALEIARLRRVRVPHGLRDDPALGAAAPLPVGLLVARRADAVRSPVAAVPTPGCPAAPPSPCSDDAGPSAPARRRPRRCRGRRSETLAAAAIAALKFAEQPGTGWTT